MIRSLTVKQATAKVGTLSAPSKMPCRGYSIPAQTCKKGSMLRKIANSVCSICYALKGRYVFPNVKAAMYKRFASLTDLAWIDYMVFLIGKQEKSGYFRWHDSGDIQGTWHLQKIAEIAKRLPNIKFWLPTREYSIVSDWLSQNTKPDNLTIRLSGFMLEGKAPTPLAKKLGLVTSGVSQDGFNCPASKQDGKCLDCRACWDQDVANVNYKRH